MAKVIILNAPAGAGKDTIGYHFSYKTGCEIVSFKAPMFNIALSILGASDYQKFLAAYNDRSQKEKPHDFLGGKSCREFMIWISESVMKPVFGSQVFGKRFAEELKDYVYVCTDGGFVDEVYPLIEAGHEVIVCRLHRTGYTFDGDSRNYVHLPMEWHGVNGYRELDFNLIEGDAMHTVNEIVKAVF